MVHNARNHPDCAVGNAAAVGAAANTVGIGVVAGAGGDEAGGRIDPEADDHAEKSHVEEPTAEVLGLSVAVFAVEVP